MCPMPVCDGGRKMFQEFFKPVNWLTLCSSIHSVMMLHNTFGDNAFSPIMSIEVSTWCLTISVFHPLHIFILQHIIMLQTKMSYTQDIGS